ncbi:MAG TPA: oxidoreductase, partial [Candidatus Bathyarchaeia archaeon]|nr:oxidoreductase [Candidatus Bathyarchaeia archaeon]
MIVLMVTLMLLVVSGLAALCCNRSAHVSNMIGSVGAVLACLTGLVSLVVALRQPGSLALALPWVVPYGSFSIGIDALTAVFLFPIFILSGLCAVYGAEYLRHYYGNKNIG